jgi:hypothetical protein
MENRTLRDVGGTPGGIGEFIIGFVMACLGGYLLSNQVSIVGSYWSFYGANTFGVTLIPMFLGVALSLLGSLDTTPRPAQSAVPTSEGPGL